MLFTFASPDWPNIAIPALKVLLTASDFNCLNSKLVVEILDEFVLSILFTFLLILFSSFDAATVHARL